MIFENDVLTLSAVVIGLLLILVLFKRNGARVDGKRNPPSLPFLSLIYAVIRGGFTLLPDYLMRSAEKLGPVFCFKVGRRMVVVLNDKEAMIEAFIRNADTFSNKVKLWIEANITNPNLKGIASAKYNDDFVKKRKLSLSILKDFGFGQRGDMESRILEEVGLMTEKIIKQNGHPFNPKHLFAISTSRVVFKILFVEKFVSVTTVYNNTIEHLDQFFKNIDLIGNTFPLLRFVPTIWKKHVAVENSQKQMMTGIDKGIRQSKETDSDSTFVKRFCEIQGSNFDEEDLRFIVRDMCLGSAETASTFLLWAMVELTNNPQVLSRLQKEIDDVVSENRLPSLQDKPHLPYLEAVILEILRHRTLVPILPPRITLKDSEALGFWIPKDSLVIGNIYSVHMDPQIWKDPKSFRPERFLDEDNKIVNSDKVIAFGLGRRSCLGEVLGRQEIFLFLSSMVSLFDILPPEGQNSIKVEEVLGATVVPSSFEVRLIKRKKRDL